MNPLERALELHRAQEADRELARKLRREATWSVLTAGEFARMRTVIPQWWEWVCTGFVYADTLVAELIDRRLAETVGLESAIIEDWA
jgi:hypothetical protein